MRNGHKETPTCPQFRPVGRNLLPRREASVGVGHACRASDFWAASLPVILQRKTSLASISELEQAAKSVDWLHWAVLHKASDTAKDLRHKILA